MENKRRIRIPSWWSLCDDPAVSTSLLSTNQRSTQSLKLKFNSGSVRMVVRHVGQWGKALLEAEALTRKVNMCVTQKLWPQFKLQQGIVNVNCTPLSERKLTYTTGFWNTLLHILHSSSTGSLNGEFPSSSDPSKIIGDEAVPAGADIAETYLVARSQTCSASGERCLASACTSRKADWSGATLSMYTCSVVWIGGINQILKLRCPLSSVISNIFSFSRIQDCAQFASQMLVPDRKHFQACDINVINDTRILFETLVTARVRATPAQRPLSLWHFPLLNNSVCCMLG